MSKEKPKFNHKVLVHELKEDPLRKFRITFGLMSVIPFLVFFYIILEKFFSFSIFVDRIGLILTLTIIISLLGFILAYSIIYRVLNRLMLYAARLKKSDQLKSTLVANVSHEVRNPLSIIRLSLDNLTDGIGGKVNTMQKDIIGRCQGTVDRLMRMVNQLLDLSKIEAGKFMMKRAALDINLLIDNELSNFEAGLKAKNLKLEKSLPSWPIIIWADHDKITQMFINLLDNAIKYTAQNGKVNVRLNIVGANVQVEIEDTGVGIPTDKIDKVFDKFERIAEEKELGTGLGLPITKDIVEMHRGRIWIDSKPGKGTKFIVALPRDLRGDKKR